MGKINVSFHLMSLLIIGCLGSSLLAQTRRMQVSPDVPRVLDYQGILTNPDGEPYNGAFNLTFTIINTKNDSVLFTETVQKLEVTDGLVHHLVGSVAGDLDPFIFQKATALRINVNGETLSPDVVIAPAPVALVALYADSLTSPLPQGSFTNGLRVSSSDTAIVAYSAAGPAIVGIQGEWSGGQSHIEGGSNLAKVVTDNEPFGAVYFSNSGTGVGGFSNTGTGVSGSSGTGTGVSGDSGTGTGIGGTSSSGNGVSGESFSGNGVYGKSTTGLAGKFDGNVEINGDLNINGGKIRTDSDGEIYAHSFHTVNDAGVTTSGIDTDGKANLKSVTSPEGLTVPADGGGENWYCNTGIFLTDKGSWNSTTGDFHTNGNFGVNGTKNAVVLTISYGTRKLYADESAEVSFFDRGRGQLVNGEVSIELDPMFLETVTIDNEHPMLVQVTLTADCNGVFVSNQTATSFTVKELMGGKSSATFNWEVAAKRKGYESVRMEEFESLTTANRR